MKSPKHLCLLTLFLFLYQFSTAQDSLYIFPQGLVPINIVQYTDQDIHFTYEGNETVYTIPNNQIRFSLTQENSKILYQDSPGSKDHYYSLLTKKHATKKHHLYPIYEEMVETDKDSIYKKLSEQIDSCDFARNNTVIYVENNVFKGKILEMDSSGILLVKNNDPATLVKIPGHLIEKMKIRHFRKNKSILIAFSTGTLVLIASYTNYIINENGTLDNHTKLFRKFISYGTVFSFGLVYKLFDYYYSSNYKIKIQKNLANYYYFLKVWNTKLVGKA